MSVPAYPAYRDTGVQWLQAIPNSWRTVPFWSLFRRIKRVGHQGEELLSVYRDYGVIRKADRDDNFNNPSEDLGTYQLVEPGNLAMNKMKAWQGSLGISPHRGIVSPAYFVYQPQSREHPEFLHYLLRSPPYAAGFMTVSKGIRVNQWDIDPDYLDQIPVCLPSLAEQAAIASFLDRETAKIDGLVAEQRRLIALLKEKRQAVISHAVTKGLNPNAEMKPSGIERLGEIPSHWEVAPLKYWAKIGNGSTPKKDDARFWANGTFPWLNSSVVNMDEVDASENFVTELALAECHLPIVALPAILMAITGQGKTRGMVAPLALTATISQHLAFIKPTETRLQTTFLLRWLESQYVKIRSDSEGAGSTKGAVTCDEIARMHVVLPPVGEQLAICQHFEAIATGFQRLEDLAEASVLLLQERRAALISAAVTGKIDVRGLVDAVGAMEAA